ncbi:MAG: CDP-alcohol phosphatidyltransferase family protein [Clostridia bacterium]|nr:CDP-alcohol phosphatidyltransferase family protein [Clostridia bacterium]
MTKKEIVNYFIRHLKIMFKDIISGDKERLKKQLANILTLTRGILSPILIVISICIHSLNLSFAIILISALTDCFDGWYARKNGYVSEFGTLLDTICDKIFSFCIIIPVIQIAKSFFIIILIIEMIISAINMYLHVSGKNPKTTKLGKIKTIILDATLVLCYFSLITNINERIVTASLVTTIAFQIIACVGYLVKLLGQVRLTKPKRSV